MKRYLLTLATVCLGLVANGQTIATLEDGSKVLLYANGKWEPWPGTATREDSDSVEEANPLTADELVRLADTLEVYEEEETHHPTSTVFMGGRRLVSGVSTRIHEESSGFTTSVSVAKDGERTVIIFWQDSQDHQINFFNWHWQGSVFMYLANGQSITLTDRGMHGQNKITGGREEYGIKSDLYQRYSAHYLTPAECRLLKQSPLAQVAYRTNSGLENGTVYMPVTDNGTTLHDQLQAIGR